MAKQKGVLKYVGTLGDIRHFKIKGQEGYFAGMVGGPTGEQINNAPEFERTRENMSEFGGCAKAGKSIRVALSQLLQQMADSQVTGRLTSIMKKINLEDGTEARGYRKIEISTQRKYLAGFDFNKDISFSSLFTAAYSVKHSMTRDSADLVLPALNPANNISAPSGATDCRLVNAIAIISDFKYNTANDVYEPSKPALNELSKIEYSSYIPLNKAYAGATITANFPAGTTLTTDVSVLQCVGIEFYQKVGANYYLLSSGNCLKIDNLF